MDEYQFSLFGLYHLCYLAGAVACWVAVIYWGKKHLKPEHRRIAAFILIGATLGQEVIDDIVRYLNGCWTMEHSLPLHLCSFAMFVSVYALLTKRQTAFELVYFWGLAACTQALITPDHTRWRQGAFDEFWNFLSHGLIILNVLWLVVVEKMRCRKGAWLKAFLYTNLCLIPVAALNLLIGGEANYWFICFKPGVDNPMIFGDWPYYLLGFETLTLLSFGLLQLPMRHAYRKVQNKAGPPSAS